MVYMYYDPECEMLQQPSLGGKTRYHGFTRLIIRFPTIFHHLFIPFSTVTSTFLIIQYPLRIMS